MAKDSDTAAERLRSEQKALAEFGQFAFRSDDIDAILRRATELVSEGLDSRLVKVLELMPGHERLLIRAGVNWAPGVVGHVTFGAGRGSPAGYALMTGEPIVSPDLAAETRFAIPPVLPEHGVRSMVNVPIPGGDGPFGVLEVDAPRTRDFDGDDVTFLQTYANLLAAAIDRHSVHQALEQRARDRAALVQELEHRVRNLLVLVLAIAQQTTAEGDEARAFQEALVGRLQALARAESLVFEDNAQAVDMRRLVERSVEPFQRAGRAVTVEGAPLRLSARDGRVMALVLHELGTNATKYGALSGPGGDVRVSWSIDEGDGAGGGGGAGGDAGAADDVRGRVRFRWAESGGPAVAPPRRKGFGTRLLATIVSYDLDGEAELEHAPTGLVYRLDFPLREV